MKIFHGVIMGLVFAPNLGAAQDLETGYSAYNDGNYSLALENFVPLAESGDAAAQLELGVMYNFGQGVLQDDTEAVRWHRLSAEQGHARAQYYLGLMYD